MLFVKSSEYNRRLAICRNCKFFEPSTQSCGTLIVGEEQEIEVQYKKKSIHLCGCVMPIKAKLSLASCPANKWKGMLTDSERNELLLLLEEIETTGKIDDNQRNQFYAYKDQITQAYNERSTCSACIKREIKLMRETLKTS
jgi:hypothetical protein